MRIDVLMLHVNTLSQNGNRWRCAWTPGFNVQNATVNIWIYQGSTGQTCVVASDLVGRGHSCCMQSFISLVDHYAASLCHLQRAQWVFEQFLGTLKSSFASVWVFAHPLFSAESPTPPLTTLPAAQIQLQNGFNGYLHWHSCFYFRGGRLREAHCWAPRWGSHELEKILKAWWAWQRYTWCWVNTFSHRYITPVWPRVAFNCSNITTLHLHYSRKEKYVFHSCRILLRCPSKASAETNGYFNHLVATR